METWVIVLIILLVLVVAGVGGYFAYKELYDGVAVRGAPRTGKTLVFFRMDGCGHCVRFEPVWKEVEASLRKMGVNTAELESKQIVGMPNSPTGFPTIRLYEGGLDGKFVQYSGPRTLEGLLDFVSKN